MDLRKSSLTENKIKLNVMSKATTIIAEVPTLFFRSKIPLGIRFLKIFGFEQIESNRNLKYKKSIVN